MASTPVEFSASDGQTLTLELRPLGSDTIANTGGDLAVEASTDKGSYTATVTEALVGWYKARVKDGSNNTIARGFVYMADDTDVKRCCDLVGSLTADGKTLPTAAENAAAVEAVIPSPSNETIDFTDTQVSS